MKKSRAAALCVWAIMMAMILHSSHLAAKKKKAQEAVKLEKQALDFDDVKIVFQQKGEVLQGRKVTLTYKVTNTSKAYLMFGFAKGEYGSVVKENDKFYHNTLVQTESAPVFFGIPEILAPNSSMEREMTIRPFQAGEFKSKVKLHYYKIDESNASKIFIHESEEESASPSGPGKITYRRVNNINEIKNPKSGILIPVDDQQDLERKVNFELKIIVNQDKKFQKIYKKYKPKDIVELKEIAQFALRTDKGTLLLENGKVKKIGNVGLSVLKSLDEIKKDEIRIWVKPQEGPIKTFLKKYGQKNDFDQMYHGDFPYVLNLPKSKLQKFFKCIKKGKYNMIHGSGMFYGGDIWVLE